MEKTIHCFDVQGAYVGKVVGPRSYGVLYIIFAVYMSSLSPFVLQIHLYRSGQACRVPAAALRKELRPSAFNSWTEVGDWACAHVGEIDSSVFH